MTTGIQLAINPKSLGAIVLKPGFDLFSLLPFPNKKPNGMTRVTRQRRSGWMAQILLAAWVFGLGTGAYGAQFPYPLGDIPLSPEAYQTNLQVIPRERMAEIQARYPRPTMRRIRALSPRLKTRGTAVPVGHLPRRVRWSPSC